MISRDSGRKRVWSRHLSEQMIELAAGLLLDPGAPQIDAACGAAGAALAGQALAHHQRDGLVERRILAVVMLWQSAPADSGPQHGREISRHAGHARGADRLDARLFDRFENGARRLALGREYLA